VVGRASLAMIDPDEAIAATKIEVMVVATARQGRRFA
jgi:hypothetical protein